MKVFLACRGKIKDVEQALSISYPTVSRLEAVVAAINGPAAPPLPPAKSGAQREPAVDGAGAALTANALHVDAHVNDAAS